MEKRKKDYKLACGSSQEPETNDHSKKDDQKEQNVALIGKNMKSSSPSNDNTALENKQNPPILQWPYAPQNVSDQSPLTSKTALPIQTPSPIVISQWHFPNQHQPQNNPAPQGHVPLNYAQPIPPFWLPRRPGHPLPGPNASATFPPLVPFATTEVTWQAPAVGGSTSTASPGQPAVPNFCYPVGYSFAGLPGPGDPLSWWDQAQQSQPPCTYSFPGAYSFLSSAPSSIPSCSAPTGQVPQKGIIRPSAKLSQKHQQLWEAQSAENVQLWNTIIHLQSELADYKNRLSKLEAEVSSYKPKADEPSAQVAAIALASQPTKRGRPKRSVAAVDAVGSPDKSHPRAQGRKPATSKAQSEAKPHVFEKVVFSKAVDNEKTRHSAATVEQGNGENTTSNAAHASGKVDMNGSNLRMPVFHNQVHLQMCGIGFAPSMEMKSVDDKATKSEAPRSILSQQAMETNTESGSAFYIGGTGDGNLGWPANVTSEEPGRNMFSTGSQSFYHNGSVIRGGKLVPGWSFVNEENASEELEEGVLGTAKDENEDDDMGEDASSGEEDIARAKDDGAHNIEGAVGTSPKGLPPLNNW